MSDVLKRIVAAKRAEVLEAKRRVAPAEIERRARAVAPTRDFVGALRAKLAAGQAAVIAEIKRASPSRGVLRADFDPASIARSYEGGGAACMSVLTDKEFFQGAAEHLQAARSACRLPALRKDFMLEPFQVFESRALGADCILLIAAVLSREAMLEMEGVAASLDMAVLVEVHDAAELESALALKTPLLGINNRDLRNFETRLETTLDLLPRVPPGRVVVTESGILATQDVARMRARGVHAFLVGEAFMRAADPGAALRDLFAAGSSH